jgi:hypothetical protein
MVSARKFRVGDIVWFGEELVFVASKHYGIDLGYSPVVLPGNSSDQEFFWKTRSKSKYQILPSDMEYSWGWKPFKPARVKVNLAEMPEEISRFMIESIFNLTNKEP